MTEAEMLKKIEDVAKYWGRNIEMMTCEECAELIQAISKFDRLDVDEASGEELDRATDNVIAEMADVIISIAAYCSYYYLDIDEVYKAMEKKLSKKYPKKNDDDAWEKWKKTLPTEFERRT